MNVKKIICYVAGITPLKNMIGDILSNFGMSGKLIGETIKSVIAVAKSTEKQINWLDAPEHLFDQSCRESGFTTESVKKIYSAHYLAGWGAFIIGVLSMFVAVTNPATNTITEVKNLLLFTVIIIVCLHLEYKMHAIREQRVIYPIAFLLIFFTTPSIWVPISLPKSYKLRIEE